MAKGSRGEVTIRYNDDRGRWETRVTVGYDPTSGRQRRRLIVGRTKGHVRDQLRQIQRSLDDGIDVTNDKRTVAAFMADWLADVLPGTVSDGTVDNYTSVTDHYIVPAIGSIRLKALKPSDVQSMLTGMADRGLSGNTQRLARSILRRALRLAERDGIVPRNVASLVDGPRLNTPMGRTMTPEQARAVLAGSADHRLGAAWAVMLTTGLRRGELLGLGWDDVDTEARTITVHRNLTRRTGVGLVVSTPKTKTSARVVHLPDAAVVALRAHRKRMATERLALGSAWPDAPLGVDFVFRSPVGTPVDPANFTKATYAMTTELLGDRWSPHEFRDTAASLLFAQAVPLKTVSEVLGHSSISVTADVYTHLLDGAGRSAADAMNSVVG